MEELQLYEVSVFILIIFSTILYFTRKQSSSPNKNPPPSPPALPIIGNLHQLSQLPHRSLWELSKKHGPLMLLWFGSKPTLVVSSAEAAKNVYKSHDLSFAARPVIDDLKKVFYGNRDLVNMPFGDEWRKLRSIFVHELLLGSTMAKSLNSIREEEVSVLMDKIKHCCIASSPVNLSNMFTALTSDLICRVGFGKRSKETENGKKFLDSMNEFMQMLFGFTLGTIVPWLGWINWLGGLNPLLDRCIKERDEILDAIIEEGLEKYSSGDHENKENFLDILLGIYKAKTPGVCIDLITIKCVLMDLFAAGTETLETALGWVMTEIVKNPTVMKKLQEEIRDTMKGKHHITNDDLKNMNYLKAVIKETFRLHPPSGIYFRAARENVKLMGYDIDKDTMVLFNAFAIGRDPEYWPEPEKFMPERFLDSSVDFRGIHYQLLPFGSGRRICPGLGFAVAGIEQTVANLMHRFDWELPDKMKGEDLDLTEVPGFITARKNPLIVVATECYF